MVNVAKLAYKYRGYDKVASVNADLVWGLH
jgi:hypothetical protein